MGIDTELLEKVLETGAALGAPQMLAGIYPYALVPAGHAIQRLPLALDRPERVEKYITVYDPKSFTEYFGDYCNADSRIFVDTQNLKIIGVIDYHGQGVAPRAEWLKHSVGYAFRHTPEWKIWTDSNKKSMDQVHFAHFLENNLPDITRPTAASLLQTALAMEAKKKANFSSAVRLDNGETSFAYEEEIRGTAAKGTLEIPVDFDLAIAPFEGAQVYKLTARLRYRLEDNALMLWYELIRPHKVIEDAVNQVVDTIRLGVSNPITFGAV